MEQLDKAARKFRMDCGHTVDFFKFDCNQKCNWFEFDTRQTLRRWNK
jgi:hypothetical protein